MVYYTGACNLPDNLKALFHPLELREIKADDRLVTADYLMDHEGERLAVFRLPNDERLHTLPFPQGCDLKIKRKKLWVLVPPSTDYKRDLVREDPLALLSEARQAGKHRNLMESGVRPNWIIG